MTLESLVRMQRHILWEEAKAKLIAMLHTYHSPSCNSLEEFEGADNDIREFIQTFERTRQS